MYFPYPADFFIAPGIIYAVARIDDSDKTETESSLSLNKNIYRGGGLGAYGKVQIAIPITSNFIFSFSGSYKTIFADNFRSSAYKTLQIDGFSILLGVAYKMEL